MALFIVLYSQVLCQVLSPKSQSCFDIRLRHALHSDPPIGTGLLDPNRRMRRQISVPTLADPSAHPCQGWSRYSDWIRHT
jgi:hypothetical protein